MGRDSYDDMVSPNNSRGRRGGNSKVGLIAALGIVFCLLVVILYLLLSSPNTEEEPKKEENTQIEVKKPEVVAVAEPVVQEVEIIEPVTVEVTEVPSVAPVATVAPTNTTTARDISQASRPQSQSGSIKYTQHIVEEGEDLNSIAELYGLKVQTIISVNKIRNIAAIVVGTELSIPDRDGQLYTVQDGDMLSTIARKYNPDLGWKKLQELNGLKSENIRVGQELFIPDPVAAAAGVVTVSAVSFNEPLKGAVLASFGQRYEGVQLDGILMRADAGSAVTASQRGAVIDAGNSDDYGRFVVIQHDEGYKTTYAYLETVTVRVGMEVEQGSVIGSIGTSSRFDEPTLFFRLEQNGIALDATLFF